MWAILGPLLLQVAKWFFSDLEKRAEWEKRIRARMREVDSRSSQSAELHSEYDRMQEELARSPRDGKPTDPS